MPDREYFNNRRRSRRQKFIEFLGGKCKHCGSTENLHFDHLNPKKKEFRIADRLDAPEKVLEKEVKKCQLLCNNCHRKKTIEKNEHGQPPGRHGTIHFYRNKKCRCDDCRKAMSEYNKAKKLNKIDAITLITNQFYKLASKG